MEMLGLELFKREAAKKPAQKRRDARDRQPVLAPTSFIATSEQLHAAGSDLLTMSQIGYALFSEF